MRACPDCGQLTEDDANFCHMCGGRLRSEPPPPPVALPGDDGAGSPLGSRPWVWLVAAAVLLLAIGAGAALVLNNPGSDAPPEGAPDPEVSPTTSAPPEPAPDASAVLAGSGTVRVQVDVVNCPGCQIDAIPADGTDPQSATVAQGSVEFALPRDSTLGLAFTVRHPDGFGSQGGPNVAVLAIDQAAPGTRITVSDLIDAARPHVCWAGTLADTATIAITVDVFGDGTAAGGLRAWGDPAQAVLPASAAPSSDGSVEQTALAGCAAARAAAAG